MIREGIAPATCDICGISFAIDLYSRCEECHRICCRSCMKISYSVTAQNRPAVSRVLCYHCFHHKDVNRIHHQQPPTMPSDRK